MSVQAQIVNITPTTADGIIYFTFTIFDSDNPTAILDTHTQGVQAEVERVPTQETRLVPQRADDGSGDVVFEDDPYGGGQRPVMIEEEYEEMVETGNSVSPPQEVFEEAIRNYVRDVYSLRTIQPSIETGATFDVSDS